MDQQTIILGLALFAVTVIAVAAILSQGSILKGLISFVKMIIENPAITDELKKRATALPESTRNSLLLLADVADPFTKSTPTDLDDATLAWMKNFLSTARPETATPPTSS